jgi:para-aminobenzoate synthetase/4-amino-4-deoxychorismate lyase
MLPSPPQALVREDPPGRWLAFERAEEAIVAAAPAEVPALLERVRLGLAEGLHAVGYLAYEAAPAFDPALVTRPPDGSAPVAWFGLFPPPVEAGEDELPAADYRLGPWEPSEDEALYRNRIDAIHEAIAAGTVYQVNHTLRLRADFEGDPRGLFRQLWRAQRAAFATWLDLGETAICSVSPELFFALADGCITTRPMKGTAPRGRTTAEDRELAARLATSPKERAENLMIVDMARNDLGRIAVPGSVEVERLFDVERYDSVFQMTSTVTARTSADAWEALAALFPAASITGAPKTSAMALIRGLEGTPRGLYTGAIGHVRPEGRARFGVAIRTITVDRAAGRAAYGTGGGIVWDSQVEEELRETRAKALILRPRPDFALLETLLWEPATGYFLLERHLDRLEDSAAYFAFPLARGEIEAELEARAAGFPPAVGRRVRLLLSGSGRFAIEDQPLATRSTPWRVTLAREPIDSADRFLFHKTTHRAPYAAALEHACAGVDDVLLWNDAGELTEATVANLVLRLDGRLVTPPVGSGLLPGTFRAELLARGEIEEGVLRPEDLAAAEELLLVNSVRRWIPATLAVPIADAGDRPEEEQEPAR